MRRRISRSIYVARDVDHGIEHRYNIGLVFGVKIQVKTHLNSHFLEEIVAWPRGFFDRIESTFLASELDTFTGYIKIAITEKTTPIDERRRVADFIIVVDFNLSGFVAYILDGEHATKFETFAKLTSNMDYTTAKTELRKYRHTTSKHSKSEIKVTNSLTNTSFRDSAKRRTKKRLADGWLLHRKAVKVELFFSA